MSTDNRTYIDKAINSLLVKALLPFMESKFGTRAKLETAVREYVPWQARYTDAVLDAQALLQTMVKSWKTIFSVHFGIRSYRMRSYVGELLDARNRYAHPERDDEFTDDDTERILDTIVRLCAAIDADSAAAPRKLKQEFIDARGGKVSAALIPVETPLPPVVTETNLPTVTTRSNAHIVVAQDGTGHYTTIRAAIREAQPGTRIEVQPGRYVGGLVIDKRLEIVGNGRREDVVIEGVDEPGIVVRAEGVKLRSVSPRFRLSAESTKLVEANQLTDAESLRHDRLMETPTIHVKQGDLLLDDCDITTFVDCILVGDRTTSADIVLRGCTIHDVATAIIQWHNSSSIALEDCTISRIGVFILSTSGPLTMRRCHIHNCAPGITLSGPARIEDCEIYAIRDAHSKNPEAAITIDGGASVIVHCRIHDTDGPGIRIIGLKPNENADAANLGRGPRCDIEDCEIYGTGGPALEVYGQTRAHIKRSTLPRLWPTQAA